MKRDMDIVRNILLTFERDGEYEVMDAIEAGHVAIMIDAGLVDAKVATDGNGQPIAAMIFRITWSGHDFLDNARSPEIWDKAKKAISEKAASVSIDILTALLKKLAADSLGVAL